MEKLFQKGIIYGFLSGLGFGILFVKYKTVTHPTADVIVTDYLPISEYIISILQYGVIGSILGVLCCIFLKTKRGKANTDHKPRTYYIEVFFIVLVVSILVGLSRSL
ncbi:hypothetical protein [Bacillus testis]|uniref:hypothetical protein n=1 Tax=Bacillus testis TaxID=1622072 RepID=UPI00067F2C14|nr:hypothetical protein [Bacillus testis]